MDNLAIGSPDLTATLVASTGKILSLKSAATGREWLWHHPVLKPRGASYGESYIQNLDSGGWDEIFPSVSPTRVAGRDIPDHGDAAQLPWAVVHADADSVELAVLTRYADCRFSRTLRVVPGGFLLEYRVENRESVPVPYLWCAHPLIALRPGMEIVTTPGSPWRCAGGVGVPSDTPFVWPAIPGLPGMQAGCFRIPDSASHSPFAAKLFSEAGAVSSVTVRAESGAEALRFSWDVAEIPHLALWLNAGAWCGCGDAPYFNLGVEPTTAPCDSLAEAVANGTARLLPAGEVVRWSLRVELLSGAPV